MSLDKHVSSVCKTWFFWLCQLRRVSRSLDTESLKTQVCRDRSQMSPASSIGVPCRSLHSHLWSRRSPAPTIRQTPTTECTKRPGVDVVPPVRHGASGPWSTLKHKPLPYINYHAEFNHCWWNGTSICMETHREFVPFAFAFQCPSDHGPTSYRPSSCI